MVVLGKKCKYYWDGKEEYISCDESEIIYLDSNGFFHDNNGNPGRTSFRINDNIKALEEYFYHAHLYKIIRYDKDGTIIETKEYENGLLVKNRSELLNEI